MRRNEGFTLVELLIVLAVIAALLATITPVALNAVKKAKASQVAQNLRNIKTAIEQYVYTEQEAPSSPIVATLVTNNYLSSNPGSNYIATMSSFNNGVAVATVAYIGGDVDTGMVTQTYQETEVGTVLGNSDAIYVEFQIPQYW